MGEEDMWVVPEKKSYVVYDNHYKRKGRVMEVFLAIQRRRIQWTKYER